MVTIGAAVALLLMAGAPADQLERAARAGDRDAAFALGRAYKLGDGVALDAGAAARWFAEAQRRGHRKAGAELGLVLFQDGKGREALPWLKAAAEAGDPRAQYALGTILFAGRIVPADPVQAKTWMARAAKAGLPAAREALAIMRQPLPATPAPPRPFEIVTIARVPAKLQWQAQLGAFSVPDNARRYWSGVKGDVAPGLLPSFILDRSLTLLRVAPFTSKAEAARFCARQRARGRACLEVRGGGS